MVLTFVKLSERWFVDIPWDGAIEDLEMISGSDIFLETLAKGKKFVTLEVTEYDEKPCCSDDYVVLTKVNEDEVGAYYKIYTYDYKGEIWLCNVTKSLFVDFPNYFVFKQLYSY